MTKTVDELREELRSARNNTDIGSEVIDRASVDLEGISRSDNRSEQSIFADISRSGSEDDAINGTDDDIERSPNEKPIGVRSTDRRFSEDRSSRTSDTKAVRGTTRRAGKLEADDPIPIRPKEKRSTKSTGTRSTTAKTESTASGQEKESKSVQRGKAVSKVGSTAIQGEGEEQKAKFSLPKFKEGSTLTIAEAKALEEPLLSALESDFYYLDQYIWYRTQDPTQAPIWSDMDNEDLQVLTGILLKRGQKSAATAATVRAIVNGSTYVDVAMLMGPRFVRTVQVLKAAPKKKRMSMLERKQLAANM